MRRPTRAVLAAVVVLAPFIAGSPAVAAATTSDALVMTSYDESDPTVPSGTLVSTVGLVAASTSLGDFALRGVADGTGEAMRLAFTAPIGQTFSVDPIRRVYDLKPKPSKQSGGVRASFRGHACDVIDGVLSINEIRVETSIRTLSATYQVWCRGAGELRGAFQVGTGRSSAGLFSTEVAVRDLGDIVLGQTVRVSVPFTYRGAGDTTPRSVAIDDGSSQYRIVDDTCRTRTTWTAGDTCAVTIDLRPLSAAAVSTTFRIGGFSEATAVAWYTVVDPDVGTYHPAPPRRLLDTRDGTGGVSHPIGPGETVTLGAPAGVRAQALVVNLTVTNPTSQGYVTAFAGGTPWPATSNINFVPGQTVANLVTVPVSSAGLVALRNAYGRTDLVVDLVGWYAAEDSTAARGGGFHPVGARRVLDTRTWGFGRLEPGEFATVPVRSLVSAARVGALSVNVTATNVAGTGYVSTWDAATDNPPQVSTLNVTPGATVANAAIVPTTYCPTHENCADEAVLGVYNGTSGPLDLVVDVNGFYDVGINGYGGGLPADVRFHTLATPIRAVDTRQRRGLVPFWSDQIQKYAFSNDLTGADTVGVDTNVTGLALDADTYLAVWTDQGDIPPATTSLLNPRKGAVVANHAVSILGYGGQVDYYNHTGHLDLVVDVDGTFERFPASWSDPTGVSGAVRPAITPLQPVAATAPRPHVAAR